MKQISLKTTMKAFVLPILAAMFVFTSCADRRTTASIAITDRYVAFVDSVEQIDYVTETQWQGIDREHRSLRAQINRADLIDRDQRTVEEAQEKFMEIRERHETAWQEQPHMDSEYSQTIDDLRNQMGIQRGDAQMQSLNEQNIESAYRELVTHVEDNATQYTEQEWAEIELIWDDLDQRRENLDLTAEDQVRIMEYRARYGAVRATHRDLDMDPDFDEELELEEEEEFRKGVPAPGTGETNDLD